MEEVAIIDGILKKLEEHKEPDLIKRAQLKWLTLELKSIRARCSGELQ